jgi:hypothetical protein
MTLPAAGPRPPYHARRLIRAQANCVIYWPVLMRIP